MKIKVFFELGYLRGLYFSCTRTFIGQCKPGMAIGHADAATCSNMRIHAHVKIRIACIYIQNGPKMGNKIKNHTIRVALHF